MLLGDKMKKKTVTIYLMIFLLMLLTSCSKELIRVSLDFNDKTGEVLVKELQAGKKLDLPDVPKREGFEFLGWYLDNKLYNFENEVTKDITLVAKWGDLKMKHFKYYEFLSENNPVVTITVKEFGTMKLELFPDVAKNTVNNFIKYVENNKYENTIFHRIIKGFMIQGGAVNNPYKAIKGEFKSNGVINDLKHYRGVLSMARTMFPNSATSQFFIMDKTSPHLDGEYASFGALIEGFDVLDEIVNTTTDSQDKPVKNIVIESITVDLKDYEPTEVVYQ